MGFAGGVALRDLNSFQAVITDDAAPYGVVEIENQDAAAFASERGEQARDVIRVERQETIREWELRKIPFGGRMPIGEAHRLCEVGDIQEDVFRSKDAFRETEIYAIDDVGGGAREGPVETAEEAFWRRGDGLKDANCLAVGFESGAERFDERHGLADGVLCLRGVAFLAPQRQRAIIHRD